MARLFLILLFFEFLVFVPSQAQTRLSQIDLSKIEQKSIRNFLKQQQEKGMVYFEDFKPSVTAQTDSSQFDYNVHRFRLRQAQATAWEAYLTAHPARVWQGQVVSCGLIYSPVSKRIIFPDDAYPGLESGQIFFIEMRVLAGLIRFPVSFMVTRIDSIRHEISFSYLASGLSDGSQTIRLEDDQNGGTLIIHSSIHQTNNYLRDKTLYPIYHRKAIGEVHRNIRKLLKEKK